MGIARLQACGCANRVCITFVKGEWPMETSHAAALQAKKEGLERSLKDELNRPAPDMSKIQLLKKLKLRLKEELSFG
jgi:hypothetical protein